MASETDSHNTSGREWDGTTFGTPWMHRTLIKWLGAIDVRVLYWFTYIFVIVPSMIFKHREASHIYRFYRKGFGYGKLKATRHLFGNYCSFGRIIIDRFAMYAGRKFDIEIEGYEHFAALSSSHEGFVQLSSHIGNYELAGYSLKAKEKRFNALVFGGEKATVMTNRSKMFEANNIRMIPIGDDMSHIYMVNEALANGEIMSIPADRIFGSNKHITADFLGHPAKFPKGPFLIAAMRNVSVIFVAVMKISARKYKIIVEPIYTAMEDNISVARRAENIAAVFIPRLEKIVKKYPDQWFNYYDFWS